MVKKWIEYIATIVGIIGGIWGIYTYLESVKEPQPTFIVDNNPRKILSQDLIGIAPLTITKANGTKVTKDVYAQTFHFFNQGKAAIKKEHILSQLYITFPGDSSVDILDFSISKKSREVTEVTLQRNSRYSQSLNISFSILEQDDGFTGQIIYSTAEDTPLVPRLFGDIEGAPKGFLAHYTPMQYISTLIPILFLIILLICFITLVFSFLGQRSGTPASKFFTQRFTLQVSSEVEGERTTFYVTYGKLILWSLLFMVSLLIISIVTTSIIRPLVDPNYKAKIELPETLL
jgi:hypothetical protein